MNVIALGGITMGNGVGHFCRVKVAHLGKGEGECSDLFAVLCSMEAEDFFVWIARHEVGDFAGYPIE